jgi:hypothetical protein
MGLLAVQAVSGWALEGRHEGPLFGQSVGNALQPSPGRCGTRSMVTSNGAGLDLHIHRGIRILARTAPSSSLVKGQFTTRCMHWLGNCFGNVKCITSVSSVWPLRFSMLRGAHGPLPADTYERPAGHSWQYEVMFSTGQNLDSNRPVSHRHWFFCEGISLSNEGALCPEEGPMQCVLDGCPCSKDCGTALCPCTASSRGGDTVMIVSMSMPALQGLSRTWLLIHAADEGMGWHLCALRVLK